MSVPVALEAIRATTTTGNTAQVNSQITNGEKGRAKD